MPFTAEVSGQDFAKLIMTGWVPVGLVLGISIGSRHDDRKTTRQARWGSGNAEVAGWTELVSESREDARRQLESDVKRLGADGVVIATMELQARQRDCPETAGRHDHIVETTLIGTAIARFARAGPPHDRPGPGHHVARPAAAPGRQDPDIAASATALFSACGQVIVELLGCGLEHPNGYGQFLGVRAVERDRPDAGQRIG